MWWTLDFKQAVGLHSCNLAATGHCLGACEITDSELEKTLVSLYRFHISAELCPHFRQMAIQSLLEKLQ